MITREQIEKQHAKTYLRTLVGGDTGSGKSFHCMTYPGVAWLANEPGWQNLLDFSPSLLKNLVYAEDLVYKAGEDVKDYLGRVAGGCEEAHKQFKDGKVQTLFFDNASFYSDAAWDYENKYRPLKTKSGELDIQRMYGNLRRQMDTFFREHVLSFPGNLVVSVHMQKEGEDAMEKKVDKSVTVVPRILGSYRNVIPTKFSGYFFLKKKRLGENKYTYQARTQKGEGTDAKNRYGLPEIVEDVSYSKIMSYVNQNKNKDKDKEQDQNKKKDGGNK